MIFLFTQNTTSAEIDDIFRAQVKAEKEDRQPPSVSEKLVPFENVRFHSLYCADSDHIASMLLDEMLQSSSGKVEVLNWTIHLS